LALGSQSTGPFPESFQGFINDPNSVLRAAIADQDILDFIAINLTTDTLSANGFPTLGVGSLYESVSNIPFLGVANQTPPATLPAQPATAAIAAAPVLNEWVRNPGGPPIPLHQGPGDPPAPITALEPFWEYSTHLQLQYSQLVILVFNESCGRT
jgi:hypothetical protein